jgi:hypothetical protein
MEFISQNFWILFFLSATIYFIVKHFKKVDVKELGKLTPESVSTATVVKRTVTTIVDGKETTITTITSDDVIKPLKGVHAGWWVFWLIVFWPALIVVAVVHFNKLRKPI